MNRQTIGKIIVGLIIAVVVVFGGFTVYGNYCAPKPGEVQLPTVKDAAYALTVRNTGTLVLSNKVEVTGDKVGTRTYIMQGYYQLEGNQFRYKPSTLIWQEKVFGQIDMKKRV